MRPKLKPYYDPEKIKTELIDAVCDAYEAGCSLRGLGKLFGLSAMKVRKILITGGAYSNDLTAQISKLHRDGKSVAEIAAMLNMTRANVNSYLPYEGVIYNMPERSVAADRQARYRAKKKSLSEDSD